MIKKHVHYNMIVHGYTRITPHGVSSPFKLLRLYLKEANEEKLSL